MMIDPPEESDDLLPEYDFTIEQLRAGVRGKFASRAAAGTNVVILDSDPLTDDLAKTRR